MFDAHLDGTHVHLHTHVDIYTLHSTHTYEIKTHLHTRARVRACARMYTNEHTRRSHNKALRMCEFRSLYLYNNKHVTGGNGKDNNSPPTLGALVIFYTRSLA